MEWRVEYLPRWYYQDGLPGETKPSYAPYLGQLSARLEEARPSGRKLASWWSAQPRTLFKEVR